MSGEAVPGERISASFGTTDSPPRRATDRAESDGGRITPAAPDPPVPAVELRAVRKAFEEVVAIAGVDLVIPAGGFYSLLGPSGSGKTTCLRLIAGFEEPDEGQILIHGGPVDQIPAYRRDVNTVFQHYALFPNMDVAKNVGYGLRQRRPRIDREAIDRRTAEVLRLVRLDGLERRHAWELSGGQQQRVALARALVNRPKVLLLDEPLGALDLKLRKQMQEELKQIQHEVGITFVHVTHDQEEAMAMSDRIAIMVDGRIAQEGTPRELYLEPRTRFVADFVGECNFLDGRVAETTTLADGLDGIVVRTERGAHVSAHLPAGGVALPVGAAATVAVRPEHVRLTPVGGGGSTDLVGTVADATFLGDQVRYRVHVPALGDLVARTTGELDHRDAGLKPGTGVSVSLDERGCLAIEVAGGNEPTNGEGPSAG